MVYSFDSRIAELYGVDEAVFIHNLYFWISKNIANGHQYRERNRKKSKKIEKNYRKRLTKTVLNSILKNRKTLAKRETKRRKRKR